MPCCTSGACGGPDQTARHTASKAPTSTHPIEARVSHHDGVVCGLPSAVCGRPAARSCATYLDENGILNVCVPVSALLVAAVPLSPPDPVASLVAKFVV